MAHNISDRERGIESRGTEEKFEAVRTLPKYPESFTSVSTPINKELPKVSIKNFKRIDSIYGMRSKIDFTKVLNGPIKLSKYEFDVILHCDLQDFIFVLQNRHNKPLDLTMNNLFIRLAGNGDGFFELSANMQFDLSDLNIFERKVYKGFDINYTFQGILSLCLGEADGVAQHFNYMYNTILNPDKEQIDRVKPFIDYGYNFAKKHVIDYKIFKLNILDFAKDIRFFP